MYEVNAQRKEFDVLAVGLSAGMGRHFLNGVPGFFGTGLEAIIFGVTKSAVVAKTVKVSTAAVAGARAIVGYIIGRFRRSEANG